jgi:hypothetical protein
MGIVWPFIYLHDMYLLPPSIYYVVTGGHWLLATIELQTVFSPVAVTIQRAVPDNIVAPVNNMFLASKMLFSPLTVDVHILESTDRWRWWRSGANKTDTSTSSGASDASRMVRTRQSAGTKSSG